MRGWTPGDHPRHERAVQLVGDALVEQVAQQVRAALAEDVAEPAVDERLLERSQVDAVRAQHQHVVRAEQLAGLLEAGRHADGREQHAARARRRAASRGTLPLRETTTVGTSSGG